MATLNSGVHVALRIMRGNAMPKPCIMTDHDAEALF